MNFRNFLPGWFGKRSASGPDPDACWTVLPSGTVYGGMDLPKGVVRIDSFPDTNAHGSRLRLWIRRDQIADLRRTLREAADRLEVLG